MLKIKFSKVLSCFVIFAIILSFIPVINVTADGEDEWTPPPKVYTSKSYRYTITKNQATITKYKGSKKKLTLPSKLGGKKVVAVGMHAFYRNNKITDVIIPKNIKTISYGAFGRASNLLTVTMQKGVQNIEANAFSECNKLKVIKVPDSVVKIGHRAFHKTAWERNRANGIVYAGKVVYKYKNYNKFPENGTIKIRAGTKGIADHAFSACKPLKKAILPKSITHIGNLAFYDSGLTEFTIPNNVTHIGDWAFYGTNITNITIPNSVKTLGNNVFSLNRLLTTVTLPNNLKIISTGLFEYCYNLKSIAIPNSVTTIKNLAFYKTGLTEIKIPNSVKNIGSNAFAGTEISKINIPNSVTKISSYTFSGCINLKDINIPNSVYSIGANAFANTPWYTMQPDGMVYAGKVAYEYKGEMPENTKINLFEGTKGIAERAFVAQKNLAEIKIPNSVITIEGASFANCVNLKSVAIPDSVVKIGSSAFINIGLTEIKLPKNLKSIGASAFECNEIKTLIIPNSVEQIDYYAFLMNKLESITIGSNVKKIGYGVFLGNNNLANINVNKNNKWHYTKNNVLFGSQNKDIIYYPKTKTQTSYKIPNGVKNIKSFSFSGNKFIEKVTIPNGAMTIEESAFTSCANLKEVTIPKSVKKIDIDAFGTVVNPENMPLGGQGDGRDFGDLVIKCYYNTAAHKFAIGRKIKFKLIDKNTIYTVNFNSRKGSKVRSKTGSARNAKISKPKNPVRKGYTFAGWYRDSKLKKKWNFKKNTVKGTITLYAKWTRKK